jgi:chemotaxis protein CheD
MSAAMQAVSFHSTPRREDPWKGRKVVRLGPGEFAVTSDPDTVLMTVLGSCVAACICDPLAGVGGLNHFMLPESPDGKWGQAAFSLRYGNFAMERLVNAILSRGGRRERLEVKVFGGGRIGLDSSGIGDRNARYVERYLEAEGMVPLSREVRGNRARRIAYIPALGQAFMSVLPSFPASFAAEEASFGRAITRQPCSGDIELFS